MAKMQVEGLQEYVKALQRVSVNSDLIIKKSVYAGSGVVADVVKEEIRKLPTNNEYGSENAKVNGITNIQKADLIESFGISPIKDDGEYINAKLGWDGYGRVKTKKYKNGVPNQVIARSIQSGTSFRKKNPFVSRSVNRSRKKAQDVMAETIDIEIEKEMK